jgi:hypothetical protein
MRRFILCFAMLVATIPIGLAARYAPLGLPWFLPKYLGSALWAIALYWLIAGLLPRMHSLDLSVIAGTAAVLVEVSRLFPEPHVDAFRLTLAGRLLLGRYFSLRNIVAYLVAIAFAALADAHFRPGRSR